MNKRTKRKLFKILCSLFVALLLFILHQLGYLNQTTQTTKKFIEQSTPGFYKVIRFDDGDTIQVDMAGKNETIRFIGVDTPETHDPRKPVQCFGNAAAAFTRTLIGQNSVRLEADPSGSNRDRYQRLLRYVFLPDGTLVNKKIISEGF